MKQLLQPSYYDVRRSRSRAQSKAGANTLFVDEMYSPPHLQLSNPYDPARHQGGNRWLQDIRIHSDVFGAIVQYPNASGSIEDYKDFVAKANANETRVAVAADLMSLVLLTPGEWGADVVFGSSQFPVSRCSTVVRLLHSLQQRRI